MNFDDWLTASQAERDSIDAFIKIPVLDIDKAIQVSANCQHLRDKAEWFLTQHTAQATLSSRTDWPGLSADERKIMVKDKVKDTQYILDSIQTAYNAIYKRILNQNNRR